MPEYTDYVKKTQGEILDAVKQAQDINVKAMTAFGDAIADYAAKAKAFGSTVTVPTPSEVIASTFGFTAELVELQKSYYVRVAESFAAAQKKASEAASPAKSK